VPSVVAEPGEAVEAGQILGPGQVVEPEPELEQEPPQHAQLRLQTLHPAQNLPHLCQGPFSAGLFQ
jgi:hypothetical protein